MGARARCARCGLDVPVTGGIAVVTAGGAVVLVCGACPEPRAASSTSAVDVPVDERLRPARRPLRRVARTVTPRRLARAALIVACIASTAPIHVEPVEAARAVLSVDEIADARRRHASVRLSASERPTLDRLAVVTQGDVAVELTWYHPIAGARVLPEKADRRFGAEREGTRRECGDGHCGVDLGGEIGTVIHAVLPGRVERIVRTADRRGGRYVKLAHSEGFVTYYMHLDAIHPDLVEGVEIAAGEPLGTLGRSGIQHSAAHLHFQVAELTPGGGRHFVDPEPMLRRAVLLDQPAPWPADDDL